MDERFRATLRRSPAPGGWTCPVWPESVRVFGTRELPVAAAIRRAIGKQAGDEVEVHLLERIGTR
ncbi:DUF1905 domain-containing protein [Geodermatophilus sp. SYSU D00804]